MNTIIDKESPGSPNHIEKNHGMPWAVQYENIHMIFQTGLKQPVHALQGLNLAIRRGSIVGLLGPNGCGKTTAISCLLGLLQPQSGSIILWERRVDTIPRVDREHMYGVLLEDTRLPPFLTVKDTITTVCRLRGFQALKLKQEWDRVVALTSIENLLDQRIRVLSKGQARRVGLAVALVGDPPLLVLDEPSAGLDVSAREEFNDLVRNLHDGSRTIIIASHLLSDIESTCTHIAIMKEGSIILYQDSEAMFENARMEHQGKDIMLDQKHQHVLDRLEIQYTTSKYPGLLLLKSAGPDHEIMIRLAQEELVPDRIEPCVNLVSLYLDHLNGANGS